MNKLWLYGSIVGIVLSVVVVVIAAITPVQTGGEPEPLVTAKYDDQWCEQMMETVHQQWQENDYTAFSEHCL